MSKLEKELSEATKVEAGRSERHVFLKKLASKASALDDETWDGLSEDAQKWVNAQVKRIKARDDVQDFPDTEEDDSDQSEPEIKTDDDEDEKEEKVAKPKKTAKPAAKAKSNGKVEKPEKVVKVKAGFKKDTVPTIIKQTCLSKPEIKTDELHKLLQKKGHKVSSMTVSSIRSAFRHSVAILQDAGEVNKSLEV